MTGPWGPGGGQPGPTVVSTGASTLAPGSKVGRFEIQDLLGQGGMGAVYLAWDPVLERQVALKSIHLGSSDQAATAARFRREGMALAQLNHPHVCQVHDWVEARGTAYIAMEFVAGQTLAAAAPGLGRRQKLRILRAIAQGLGAAHAKGVVHRDLKPTNVMVDATGQVKVLDFGLARLTHADAADDQVTGKTPNLEGLAALDGVATVMDAGPGQADGGTHAEGRVSSGPSSWGEMTEAGVFVGSPIYASPEQMGGRKVGPPSDVFSLGVLAWELLLGDHPFPGEGRARMTATLAGNLKPLRGRGLSPRLGALLRSMLAHDPALRPTIQQVIAQLDQLLAQKPVLWWAGLILMGLALSGTLGYQLYGRGILADLHQDHPPRLAVMPIRNDTGDASLDPIASVGLTELLAGALRSSPSLSVVEPEAVGRVLSTLHMGLPQALEPEVQPRIAAALGADLYLRGELGVEPGSRVRRFRYQLLDLSGRTRAEGSMTVAREGVFAPYALVDPAVHDLLRRVDPLRTPVTTTAPVPPEVFAAYANGKALFLKGDFKGSEPFLRTASLQAPGFSSAVSSYAACLRRLGQEQATVVANWALMAARATGDRWGEVRALGLKAYLAKDHGQLDESQRLRETSLALARAIGDLDGEAIATNHLGLIEAERGRTREAEAYYQRSLSLSQQTGDRGYLSLAQNNLANLALSRGDLGAAGALYQQNLTLQEQLGNRWGEALALNNLGVVALMARQLPEAEAKLERARSIREAVGDRAGQVTCLRNLGILATMQGLPDAARERHHRALDLARTLGLKTVEAECQFYVAELDRLAGRLDVARKGYRAVLDLLPEGVTPGVRANAQAALVECLVRGPRPDLVEARKLCDQLPGASADSPYVHRARAWIAHRAGARGAALAELEQALADPRRQAPELRAELEQAQAVFAATGRSAG